MYSSLYLVIDSSVCVAKEHKKRPEDPHWVFRPHRLGAAHGGNTWTRYSEAAGRASSPNRTSSPVQGGEIPARVGDPAAQLGRLEHLDVGPEAKDLAVSLREALERDDDAAAGLDLRLAGKEPAHLLGDAQADVDLRSALFERARPFLPELRELEAGWALERFR